MTYVVGGCSTYSKTVGQGLEGYPQHLFAGRGTVVWNRQGDEWIDWTASLGAVTLGYREHYVYGCLPLTHPLEEATAEVLCRIVRQDQVRWCKNGSDATEAAVRIARYKTGRKHVLTSGYHGSHGDLVLATPGKSGGVLNMEAIVPIETMLDVEMRLRTYDTAAVLIEPTAQWELPKIRRLCTEAGVLLIFDEMLTGFRSRYGSMAPDVIPDLSCWGKAIGNGASIAALAGKREYMQLLEKAVFMSGTYAAEVGSLQACHEALLRLQGVNWDMLKERTDQLAEAVGERGTLLYPGRIQLTMPDEAHRKFIQGMAQRGHLIGRDIFVQHVHTDEQVQRCIQAMGEV